MFRSSRSDHQSLDHDGDQSSSSHSILRRQRRTTNTAATTPTITPMNLRQPEKKRSYFGGVSTLGAARSFEVIEPAAVASSINNDIDIAASSSSELPSPRCITPTRRLNSESRTSAVANACRSPDTPSMFVAHESSSCPSKQEKVQNLRSILQQKKEILFQLVDKKSEHDKMLHRLKKQVIHLKMQIKDESYNAGKEVIKLHEAEQQQKSSSIVLDELVHETLSGVSELEREFINVNYAFLKRFYRLPEGMTNFLMSNSTSSSSAPFLADNSGIHNNMEQPSFVYVDPVQVGYLKKSVIDSRMSILRLEKQMLYLKGLCEQVAKSLQEDLQDVLQNRSAMDREYNHQVEQLNKDRQSLHETLVLRLACKEKELKALIHEVMIKQAQNQELRNAVSTCQTEKALLESDMINQISILTKETEQMEYAHNKHLKEKDKEIKYLQRSMDDMNAQYRESGLVLNCAHIQRLLTMQDSSATFSFSGDETTNNEKSSSEGAAALFDAGETPLDLNSIFQCGSTDLIVQENETSTSLLQEDENKLLRQVAWKLGQVVELLTLLPLFPYQTTLIFSKANETMNHILSDDILLRPDHNCKNERTLGCMRGTISNMLKPFSLDESMHNLAAKVMLKDLKAARQRRMNRRVRFLPTDNIAENFIYLNTFYLILVLVLAIKLCGLHIGHETLQDLTSLGVESLDNSSKNCIMKVKQRVKQRHRIYSSSLNASLFEFRGQSQTTSESMTGDAWSVAAVDRNMVAADGSNINSLEALYSGRLAETII